MICASLKQDKMLPETYRVGQKKWYLSYNVIYVREVSLFWPTLYISLQHLFDIVLDMRMA